MWLISQNQEQSVNLDWVQSIEVQKVKTNSDGKVYYVFGNSYDKAILQSPVAIKTPMDDDDDGCYIHGEYNTVEEAKQVHMEIMQAARRGDPDFQMPPCE